MRLQKTKALLPGTTYGFQGIQTQTQHIPRMDMDIMDMGYGHPTFDGDGVDRVKRGHYSQGTGGPDVTDPPRPRGVRAAAAPPNPLAPKAEGPHFPSPCLCLSTYSP
jgi:hypothetical protein